MESAEAAQGWSRSETGRWPPGRGSVSHEVAELAVDRHGHSDGQGVGGQDPAMWRRRRDRPTMVGRVVPTIVWSMADRNTLDQSEVAQGPPGSGGRVEPAPVHGGGAAGGRAQRAESQWPLLAEGKGWKRVEAVGSVSCEKRGEPPCGYLGELDGPWVVPAAMEAEASQRAE